MGFHQMQLSLTARNLMWDLMELHIIPQNIVVLRRQNRLKNRPEGKSVSVEMQKPGLRESEVERLAGTIHKDHEYVLQI